MIALFDVALLIVMALIAIASIPYIIFFAGYLIAFVIFCVIFVIFYVLLFIGQFFAFVALLTRCFFWKD